MHCKTMSAFTLLSLLLLASSCFAAQDIPALKGAWSTRTEGGVLVWGEKTGKYTHWENKQTVLEGELVIKEQNGRVLSGEFRSKNAAEPFIGVIGVDNATVYFGDTDGLFDARIVDQDTMEIVYRHVTGKDTVVAVGVWKRKK